MPSESTNGFVLHERQYCRMRAEDGVPSSRGGGRAAGGVGIRAGRADLGPAGGRAVGRGRAGVGSITISLVDAILSRAATASGPARVGGRTNQVNAPALLQVAVNAFAQAVQPRTPFEVVAYVDIGHEA